MSSTVLVLILLVVALVTGGGLGVLLFPGRPGRPALATWTARILLIAAVIAVVANLYILGDVLTRFSEFRTQTTRAVSIASYVARALLEGSTLLGLAALTELLGRRVAPEAPAHIDA